MSSDLQHCDACQEEYVAGIAACVECGGPLIAGPLQRRSKRERGAGGAAAGAPADGRPECLIGELPGLQADHLVRALLMENIRCRVTCRGMDKVYEPGQPPNEPFAISLPVNVYVDELHREAAQDIVASFGDADIIGEQWNEAPADDESEALSDDEPQTDESQAPHDEVVAPDDPVDVEAPAVQSTSLRTVVVLVIVGIVLLFVFGR